MRTVFYKTFDYIYKTFRHKKIKHNCEHSPFSTSEKGLLRCYIEKITSQHYFRVIRRRPGKVE